MNNSNFDIVITIVLTRQCNLRCNYCGINFSDNIISYNIIDVFLNKLRENRKKFNLIKFELFGGEPTLEFDKIKYIVDNAKDLKIDYSIVTNGFLLDDEKMNFFISNNFEVFFSVAFHTKKILIEKAELFKLKNIDSFIINFIIEPGKEILMYDIFKKLILLGFRKFNILPVHYTVNWSKNDIFALGKLLKKIYILYFKLFSNNLKLFLYYLRVNDKVEFHVNKTDIEILLDYDGKIYGDYDSELRLLKDFINNNKEFKISDIYLANISDNNFSIPDLIEKSLGINKFEIFETIRNKGLIYDNIEELTKVLKDNDVNNISINNTKGIR